MYWNVQCEPAVRSCALIYVNELMQRQDLVTQRQCLVRGRNARDASSVNEKSAVDKEKVEAQFSIHPDR